MNDRPRYSQYLIEKAAALEKTLDFFLKDSGIHCRSINETLLVFMDQIFFWDWEIDELRYSFDSFAARSKSWQGDSLKTSIESQVGILLRKNVEEGINFNRYVRKHGAAQVTAPYDACNRVINKWNQLLSRCEERLMANEDFVENCKTNMNAQLEPNLHKFRKKLVFDTKGP